MLDSMQYSTGLFTVHSVSDQIQNLQNTMYNFLQFVQFFHSGLTVYHCCFY
jgi:hypothetical protein